MASQKKLCVRSDGSFKVMQIADLQEIPAISPDTLKLMNAALDREKPDLVVFTGDQIKGYGITFRGGDRKKKVEDTLHRLLEPVVRRNIPFAPLFGNHDGQVGCTNQEQMQIYQRYEQCVGMDDPALPGCGNYDLHIYSNDGRKSYILNPDMVDAGGFMRESPAIPDINTGEFDAIAEKGDVMAMFVGHDHINSFVGHYQNVDLVYTPGSGFNVYGPGVERAVRVIELNENQPHAYESHTLSYEELFGKKVSNPVKDFFYVHSPTTPEAAVPLILKTLGVVTASVAFIVLLKKLLS